MARDPVASESKPTPTPRGGRRRLSRRKRFAFAAAAACLSTTMALLLGEFAARWHIEGSFLEAVDSVTGWRTAADPGAGPPNLVQDPDLGFRLNPAREGVNSRGLRFPPVDAGKPEGRFRCLLLGDSVAYPMNGFFQELAQHLHARLAGRVDVINGALYGYTTYQERMFLERDLLPLEPDLVILQYCVNDNHRFLHRITSKGRRLLTLEAKNYLFPEGGGLLSWLSRNSYLVYSLRKLMLSRKSAEESLSPWNAPASRAAWTESTWVEQEEHIRSMAASLESVGGRLAVLAIPCRPQLAPELLERDREFTLMPQNRLGAICASLGIPYLDVHEDFFASRKAELFADEIHLAPAGHRLTGRLLVEFLEARDLLPE